MATVTVTEEKKAHWYERLAGAIADLQFIPRFFAWLSVAVSYIVEPTMGYSAAYLVIQAAVPFVRFDWTIALAKSILLGGPELIIAGAFILAQREQKENPDRAKILTRLAWTFLILGTLTVIEVYLLPAPIYDSKLHIDVYDNQYHQFFSMGLQTGRVITAIFYSVYMKVIQGQKKAERDEAAQKETEQREEIERSLSVQELCTQFTKQVEEMRQEFTRTVNTSVESYKQEVCTSIQEYTEAMQQELNSLHTQIVETPSIDAPVVDLDEIERMFQARLHEMRTQVESRVTMTVERTLTKIIEERKPALQVPAPPAQRSLPRPRSAAPAVVESKTFDQTQFIVEQFEKARAEKRQIKNAEIIALARELHNVEIKQQHVSNVKNRYGFAVSTDEVPVVNIP